MYCRGSLPMLGRWYSYSTTNCIKCYGEKFTNRPSGCQTISPPPNLESGWPAVKWFRGIPGKVAICLLFPRQPIGAPRWHMDRWGVCVAHPPGRRIVSHPVVPLELTRDALLAVGIWFFFTLAGAHRPRDAWVTNVGIPRVGIDTLQLSVIQTHFCPGHGPRRPFHNRPQQVCSAASATPLRFPLRNAKQNSERPFTLKLHPKMIPPLDAFHQVNGAIS